MSTFAWGNPFGATVATVAIGFFGFATVTPLQLLVIRAAGDAKTLASSVNISAFNIGNALGAALGGAAVASGAPLATIGIAAGVVTFAGTILAVLSVYIPVENRQSA